MSKDKENAIEKDAWCEDADKMGHLAEVGAEDENVKVGRQQAQHHDSHCRNEQADFSQVQGEFLGIASVVGIGDAGILHKCDTIADDPDGLG